MLLKFYVFRNFMYDFGKNLYVFGNFSGFEKVNFLRISFFYVYM